MTTKQPTKGAGGRKDAHGDKGISTQKAAQKEKSRQIENIMKTFSTSKPTNVDAQRIVCVLEALIDKVEILRYLDNDLFNTLNDKGKMANNEEHMAQLTDNTRFQLLREADLEIKLKPLLGNQDLNIADKTNDESSPTIDLTGLTTATAKNIRNLIRELQNNASDFDIVKAIKKGGPMDDCEDFLVYLKGLKALMLKRLSTSVEEQASHDRQKEELDRKIHLWERTKANKESELANLKNEKEKYIREKDEELNKLKSQIDEIGANKDKKMKELEQESKRDQETMKKNFEEKEATLKKQLQSLQDDLKELRKKNKDEENQLRDKKNRDEAQLKEIIDQYDDMMENKEKEITELETDLMKIEKEIKDYQESLAILKAEEEKEKEIAKKIAKKKELHDTEKDRVNNIVQAIQNAWKLYKIKAKPGKKKKGKKAKK